MKKTKFTKKKMCSIFEMHKKIVTVNRGNYAKKKILFHFLKFKNVQKHTKMFDFLNLSTFYKNYCKYYIKQYFIIN